MEALYKSTTFLTVSIRFSYFVLIFAVPVARLFSIYSAASVCNVCRNLIIGSFSVFRSVRLSVTSA